MRAARGVWVGAGLIGLLGCAPAPDPQAQAGWAVWRAQGCAACHALETGADETGPAVRGLLARRGPTTVRHALGGGHGNMPIQTLSEAEKDQLLALFAYLDRHGTPPPDER
jgi:mono/diheme cytochrome c family protein